MKRLIVVLLVVALLMIMGTGVSTAHEGGPHVRIAHLAPSAPAVDIYVNNTLAAGSVKFKDVTDYLPVEGSEFVFTIVPAGGKLDTDALKNPLNATFKDGDTGYYTVAAVGDPEAGTFELILLPSDGPQDAKVMPAATPAAMEKASATVGNIEISGAWARATAVGSMGHGGMDKTPEAGHGGMAMDKVSAAYMLIANRGDKPDRLVKVECPLAMMAELHETKVVNDIAQMTPLTNGVEIPAGGSAELKPGGMHVMLMNLKQDFVSGMHVGLILTFESGTVVEIDVPVMQP